MTRLRSLGRRWSALCHAGFATWAEYRAELVLWVLTSVLPLILLGVWRHASTSGVYALGPADFTRYFLVVFLVRQVTAVWVIWEFEGLLTSGNLSPLLLQPQSLVLRFVAFHVTERVVRLPFASLIALAGFWFFPDAAFRPALSDLGLGLLAMLVTFATRFAIQYAFAMVTFWSERASSLEELWFLAYLFLAGMLAPLDVYPASVRTLAEWTPFPYLVYFPAQLLLGRATEVGRGFAVLFGWGALGCLACHFLYRRGVRRYSAMGA